MDTKLKVDLDLLEVDGKTKVVGEVEIVVGEKLQELIDHLDGALPRLLDLAKFFLGNPDGDSSDDDSDSIPTNDFID